MFLLFVTHSTKVGFSSYTLISRKMVFSDFLIVSCFCLSTADVGTFALMNSLSLYFLFLNSSSDFFFFFQLLFRANFYPFTCPNCLNHKQTKWLHAHNVHTKPYHVTLPLFVLNTFKHSFPFQVIKKVSTSWYSSCTARVFCDFGILTGISNKVLRV